MRTWFYIIGCFCLLTGLWNCMDDLGNYDYDFDGVPELKIDTTGVDRAPIWAAWNVGDTIRFFPKVQYNKPENLTYAYFLLPNPYRTVTVGNAQVYPPADTICRTLDLDYIVDLEPGKAYTLYLMVKDSVLGTSTSMNLRNYLAIPEAGAVTGIYCLQEKEGRVDIDVFGTNFGLVYGTHHTKDYWSSAHPDRPLSGNARMISYSSAGNWFYVFTDTEGFRCSPSNLVIMDTWEEMFYDATTYAPEAIMTAKDNGYDFLINDGKLHCLNVNKAGNRKFPAPLSGNYQLAPYLAYETRTTWRPVTGAINAYQVVFDKEQNGFRPFFNNASSLGQFSSSDPEAAFDVNKMQGELVYYATVGDGVTMAVMKREDGSYWMDIASFYNVVDNGKLARNSWSLAGCTDIDKASYFWAPRAGTVLFYAVGNQLYSFSFSTGQATSELVWSGESSDEITCMYSVNPSGWPASGKILWVAVWDETTQEGRVVEFGFDHMTGKIAAGELAWMGISDPGPNTYNGFGKIISMAEKN